MWKGLLSLCTQSDCSIAISDILTKVYGIALVPQCTHSGIYTTALYLQISTYIYNSTQPEVTVVQDWLEKKLLSCKLLNQT